MSGPYQRIPNTFVPAQFHLQDDSSSYQQAVDERSGNPVGNLGELAPVRGLTRKELEKYVLDHEIFIKNIDIVSKNETSLHALVPQFVVLLQRMHALKHTSTERTTMSILCIFLNVPRRDSEEWDIYPELIQILKNSQYEPTYEQILQQLLEERNLQILREREQNLQTLCERKQLLFYSLEELRRRMCELKIECVDISFSRYCEVKLRQSEMVEWRDLLKFYLPLIFSTVSVTLALYNFFYGKK